jgi:hypothetical protein
MSQVVEINDEGELSLPAEVLEQVKPHRRFVVQLIGEMLILRPEDKSLPFWATATPEERAEDLRQWVRSHEDGPGLPDEALSRETLYD